MRACTLVLLAAAVGARVAATPVVWQGLTPDGTGVTVYSDDSYSFGVGGTPWLTSAGVAIHVNNTWFVGANASTAAGSPAATCTFISDTDCHGDDLYFFNSTEAQACCDNCSATPGCGAWTWTNVTLDTQQGTQQRGNSAPPEWANRCYIKADCAGRMSYPGHISGVSTGPNSPVQPLQQLSSGAISGNDAVLGQWSGYQVLYAAGATGVQWQLSFKYYPSQLYWSFEQAFPAGVPLTLQLNTSYVLNATSGDGPCVGENGQRSEGGKGSGFGEFCSSLQPSTLFPAWSAAPSAPSAAGYVTWSGRFSYIATGAGMSNGLNAVSGAEGGPLVLFDVGGNGSYPGTAVVLGPHANFKTTVLGTGGPLQAPPGSSGSGVAAAGVLGSVTSLPAGYVTATGMTIAADTDSPCGTCGAGGAVTGAMHRYGGVLQQVYGTQRFANDVVVTASSYWTDNGAYYDFYAKVGEGVACSVDPLNCPQAILMALADTFRNGTYGAWPIPVASVQLDAYWMPNVRANGNCKINDTVRGEIFPAGLPALSQYMGAALNIYNGPTCANSTYAAVWPMIYSNAWNQGWGAGWLSNIHPDASADYYRSIFTSPALALRAFSLDFDDFNFLLFPYFTQNVTAMSTFYAGLSTAALQAGIGVQLCMSLPSDFLESVRHNAFTNARASQDYNAGGGNWQIGGSSLLASSVGLRPSKDNFWTSSYETSPFLVAAVALLSTGPVGFADALHATNPAVLFPTCSWNGTLLQPSRPATTLDAAFVPGGPKSSGDLRAAHSAIPATASASAGAAGAAQAYYYTVLAAGSGLAPVAQWLSLSDLWPAPPSPAPAYVVVPWNVTACTAPGPAAPAAPAAGCFAPLSTDPATRSVPTAGQSSPTFPGDAHPSQLATVCPVLSNGYILLGELAKYVQVSPNRFAAAGVPAGGAPGIAVSLRGAPAEAVTLTYAVPVAGQSQSWTLAQKTLTLDASGTASTTLV